MATSYPGTLDAYGDPAPSTPLNDPTYGHAAQHKNHNDAIEAIEAELGTIPKGSDATVKARLNRIDGVLGGARVYSGTSFPVTPVAGDVWIDTT